jgi:putative oxidoreductase
MHATVSLIGRILLSAIFIAAGVNKILSYDGTLGFMANFGVPGALLPAVIALELLGGIAILIGFYARWAALALAIFTLVAAAIFHSNFADQIQIAMFMKNAAISGGLLLLFANGAGRYAIRD